MSTDPKASHSTIPTPLQRHRIVARLRQREKDREAALHRQVLQECIEHLRTDPSDPAVFRSESKIALEFVAEELRGAG